MKWLESGGPAFPVVADNDSVLFPDPGMSLRDYFAGQALVGLCASFKYHPTSNGYEIAVTAYGLADAMLVERKK